MYNNFVRTTAVACLLTAGLTGNAAAQQLAPSDTWQIPSCRLVAGNDGVTYTRDEGATYTPTARPLTGTSYSAGVVALGAPNVLLSTTNSRIYRSTDAGCVWIQIADLGAASGYELLTLAAAGADRAYVWADNRGVLFRLDGRTVTTLKSPAVSILGLAVDPADANRVRLGDDRGQIWESVDGGVTWNPVGNPSVTNGLWAYRVAFDPLDLDHVVVGAVHTGTAATFDGGRTWTTSTGLSTSIDDTRVNVFNVVVSPADPRVVWAVGIDLATADTDPGRGRYIFRSEDGGLTFTRALHEEGGIILVNGPTMAAHPADPDVLYFVFGTYYGNYGTDLFRLDAATGQVTVNHNAYYHGINAIEFSPADPAVMYLGLEHVQPGI